MNYWLDLFTGTTWREFREAGGNISGFRGRQATIAKRVQAGDIFLCYLTGVMRWVGALEILGRTSDMRRIWKEEDFPVRFAVKPLLMLVPEHGVPMEELEGQVKFYALCGGIGYVAFGRQPHAAKKPAQFRIAFRRMLLEHLF